MTEKELKKVIDEYVKDNKLDMIEIVAYDSNFYLKGFKNGVRIISVEETY